jgi:hypothetical protein
MTPHLASPLPLLPGVTGSAVFSDCMKYRYVLERSWGDGPRIAFIGLNPSCASANEDDRTVRKCQLIARRLGAGGMYMLNLFPVRATDPRDMSIWLLGAIEEVADQARLNSVHILTTMSQCEKTICAWGANEIPAPEFISALREVMPLHCLGVTHSGQPRHPLYLRNDVDVVPWL